MRILKYLTLFFKTIKSESECGELRTAIPGLDIPRKWPWLTDGPNGIEILLDNGDKLVLLDGNIELGRNRYHHPIEFNSKLQFQPFIPNLMLEKSNPSVGRLFEHGQIPICLSKNDQFFVDSVKNDYQSGTNESLCYLALKSTESINIQINADPICKERVITDRL